eukprot:1158140-Pelagomonas_calceolata.AAC.5
MEKRSPVDLRGVSSMAVRGIGEQSRAVGLVQMDRWESTCPWTCKARPEHGCLSVFFSLIYEGRISSACVVLLFLSWA